MRKLTGKLPVVDCEQGKILQLEPALPDRFRWQFEAGDLDRRLGAGDRAHDVGCGDDEAIAEVDAVARPVLRRVLHGVDRIDAQRVVGRLALGCRPALGEGKRHEKHRN